MTNKELKQAKKDLCDILKTPTKRELQHDQLEEWLTKYGVYHRKSESIEEGGVVWWREAVENAHRFLQTEMMFNACVSSKQSCKWAAIAATVAAIGVIAGWYTYLFKMIILMFKGI